VGLRMQNLLWIYALRGRPVLLLSVGLKQIEHLLSKLGFVVSS